ncbi:unnamed protein product [Paramecium sonneborni]|uniref:Uncharacterized protein n=1 Tax=Paramecium sonneborni TaxID=65129 RepID=A0A8S1RJH6_9CILI|nr:unnamed protein product [Paramecium sonneborni]
MIFLLKVHPILISFLYPNQQFFKQKELSYIKESLLIIKAMT